MAIYTVRDTSYSLQNDAAVVSKPITSAHFGGNFLIHQTPEPGELADYIQAVRDLGVSNLRYPGGTITEALFDMKNPNAAAAGDENLIGQDQFLTHAASLNATVTLVIPTRTAFATGAWRALQNGTYGDRTVSASYDDTVRAYVKATLAAAADAGVVVKAIEIGNEFWLGGQMTAAEYGRVANIALAAAQQGINDAIAAGDTTAARQPDLVVQSIHAQGMFSPAQPTQVWLVDGEITNKNPNRADAPSLQIPAQGSAYQQLDKIIAELSPASRVLIDGIADHYYASYGLTVQPASNMAWGQDGNQQFMFTQMDTFESRLGLPPGSLDRYVTEWNAKTSGAPDNRGMAQVAVMLDQFYEMATHGVTAADIWPLWFQNANDTALLRSHDFSQRVPGAIFKMMSESLIGTTALFDYDSRPGPTINAESRLDVHGYSSASRLVIFASNLSTSSQYDMDLELNAVGDATLQSRLDSGRYFIVQTQLESDRGGVRDPGLNDGNVTPVISVGNGMMATGDNIRFLDPASARPRGLDPYGVWRIEITHVTSGADRIIGRSGNDVIQGLAGNDTIYGGDGSDQLWGGAGADYLNGGSGADMARYDQATAAVRADLTAPGTNTGEAAGDTYLGIERLSGSAYNDTLRGNAEANILYGQGGADALIGEGGNDTYVISGADTVLEAANGGTDLVISPVNYTLGANVENLSLTGAAVTGTGNALNNRITGNAAANILSGEGGHDTLVAGAGADRLIGGAGRDALFGGKDASADQFVFNAPTESVVGSGRDKVYDFTTGVDDFDLRTMDANAGLAGDQAFAFSGTTARANAVWYVDIGSDIVIRGDTTGDGVADFEIQVVGVNSVAAGDFLL